MGNWDDHKDRKRLADEAESEGRVADSRDVRMALMKRVKAGELTLEEAQKELKAIKRNAKKNGQVTRAQAYSGY